MRRLRIVLFGVLFVILSYPISHAFEIDCETIHCEIINPERTVKIAWDEVTSLTNGENISSKYPEGHVIGYLLYITHDKDDIEEPETKEPHWGLEVIIAPGIWNGSDLYYVGVQTAIYIDENLVEVSEEICWSDNKACTNKKPFVLKVKN